MWQDEQLQPNVLPLNSTLPVFPYSAGLVAISVVTIALWFFNWLLHLQGYSWNQWCSILSDVAHPLCKLYGGAPSVPVETRYQKPRNYTKARKFNHRRQLGFALGLLASSATGVSPFRLKSESQLRRHFRQFRSFQGLLNMEKLKDPDQSLLHQHIKRTNAEFIAAAGGNNNVFSAICDSGCSFSVTNDA